MQRVAVVGSPGSGKSTFARALGTATQLPVVHLDEQYWSPGWVETPRSEWVEIQGALVSKEQWIIEGNYSNTFDVRFARADTVIVLAIPRRICIYRVLKRVTLNWRRDTQAPGCPEHFDLTFMRLLWEFPRNSRPRLVGALERFEGRFDVVHLSSSAAARRYLERLAQR